MKNRVKKVIEGYWLTRVALWNSLKANMRYFGHIYQIEFCKQCFPTMIITFLKPTLIQVEYQALVWWAAFQQTLSFLQTPYFVWNTVVYMYSSERLEQLFAYIMLWNQKYIFKIYEFSSKALSWTISFLNTW